MADQPETRAVHAGLSPDPATGAIMPPLHLSTTFERAADGSYPHGYVYSRQGNPNRDALERALAELEDGTEAVAFPSGMAAALAVFSSLQTGAHVVAGDDCYYGVGALLREHFPRWGLEVDFVPMTQLDAVRAALRPETALLWAESPSNPLVRISDLPALAEIAHDAGARLAVDNTWPTPLGQQPLGLGADFAVHSTTKYLAGHSDVLGGAVVVREPGAWLDRLRSFQEVGGVTPAPFDCWLTRRGMLTLGARLRVQTANAQRLAEFLVRRADVEAVHYPGLPEDPGHALAARQMRGFGGMLSFVVAGGAERALRVAAAARLFRHATSLGGPESLIEHRASVEGPDTRAPAGLLRISAGLEHADDLIADLHQALES